MTTKTPQSFSTVAGTLAGVVEALVAVSADLEFKIDVITRERDEAKKTIKNLQTYRSKLEGEIRDLRDTAAGNRDQVLLTQKMAAELEECREALKAQERISVETQKEATDLAAKLLQAEERLENAGPGIDVLQSQLKEANEARSDAEQDRDTAIAEGARSDRQLSSTISAMQTAQGQLTTTRKKLTSVEADLKQAQEANLDLTSRNSDLVKQLDETASQLFQVQTELTYAREETPQPSGTPNMSEIRALLNRAAKNFEDAPEKAAGAIGDALTRLGHLEGTKK